MFTMSTSFFMTNLTSPYTSVKNVNIDQSQHGHILSVKLLMMDTTLIILIAVLDPLTSAWMKLQKMTITAIPGNIFSQTTNHLLPNNTSSIPNSLLPQHQQNIVCSLRERYIYEPHQQSCVIIGMKFSKANFK